MGREYAPVAAAKKIIAEQKIESFTDKFQVPIEKIIELHGISYHETTLPSDDISGILYLEAGKKPQIIINGTHSDERKRFTAAHELGHFILHKQTSGIHIDKRLFFRNKVSKEATDPAEVEANRFAAELLMPKKLISKAVEKMGSSEDIVKDLAREFKVSTMAMGIRLERLGYLLNM